MECLTVADTSYVVYPLHPKIEIHIENDVTNPTNSGLGWVDKSIANGTSEIVNIALPNPDQSVDAILNVGFVGGTSNIQVRKFPSHLLRIYSPGSNNISAITITGVGLNPMVGQANLYPMIIFPNHLLII